MNNTPFYVDALEGNDTLKPFADKLRKASERPSHELLGLYEEIVILKQAGANALKLYAAAQILPAGTMEEINRKATTLANALAGFMDIQKQTRETSLAAAKIAAMNADTVSLHTARTVVDWACELANRIFGPHVGVRQFEEALRASIEISSGPSTNEKSRVGHDLRAMDSLTAQ